MIDERELMRSQPIVYQTIKNGLQYNQVAHAYLFTGPNGTPKEDTAILLAKSILCEEAGEFACGHCSICQRVENRAYTDLIILDGKEATIKKDQIVKLQEQFNKTGLERYNKKIYIMNEATNATPEALNSLLKFLEEPAGEHVYAILITEKVDRLLDTIISRCQNITFRPLSQDQCAIESIKLGVDDEDAYILSRIVKDPIQINEISLDERYHQIKTQTMEFLEAFLNDGLEGAYWMSNMVKIDKKFDKQSFQRMIEIMVVFFNESIVTSFTSSQPLWNELVKKGKRKTNIKNILHVLLETNDALQRYPNLNLLVDQMCYRMNEGV